MKIIPILVAAGLMLVGCAPETAVAEDVQSRTPVPSPTPAAEESPRPAMAAMEEHRHIADEIRYVCYTDEGRKGPWFSPESIWESSYFEDLYQCELDLELALDEYVLTELEQEAIEAGGPDRIERLELYYLKCARPDLVSGYTGGNEYQAREAAGALTLCPDHPEAVEAEEFIAKNL